MQYSQVHLLIFFLTFGSACGSQKLYQTEDYAYVGGYTLGLEGPAVDRDGNLFFVNPNQNGTIGKVSAQGVFSLWIDSLPQGSIANGIRFGSDGRMFLADYVRHQVLVIPAHQNTVEVYAHDTLMNQPNDLAIAANGTLYASDPNWANNTGNIWRIDVHGQTTLLDSDMGTTNGIEVGPGDSLLYVNESGQRKIWVFDLSPQGQISNQRLLIAFPDHGLDGMRVDQRGHLYVARYGKGVITMISPQGELIREIKLKGQKPTNLAFGGPDGRTVYVTCQDRGYIESFRAEYPGRSWALP